jgi:hypothetical protein
MRTWPLLTAWLLLAWCAGCGTTKWTDTRRTATEQLLISDAVDRAVSQIDFRALAGKTVYIDPKPLLEVTDKEYLVSTIRQHVLANGGLIKDKPENADYILEVRAGAVGTNHYDVLFGVPATNVPASVLTAGVPAAIPELPLVKKTQQLAVAKVYVFAYNRITGRPVWQSGAVPGESMAKDLWVLGAGPFQRGKIYEGSELRSDPLPIDRIPLIDPAHKKTDDPSVSIADEAYFVEPETPPQPQMAQQPSQPLSQAGPPPAVQPGPAAPPPAVPVPPPATNPAMSGMSAGWPFASTNTTNAPQAAPAMSGTSGGGVIPLPLIAPGEPQQTPMIGRLLNR